MNSSGGQEALSAYESERLPRPLMEPPENITVHKEMLKSKFTCPICTEVIHEATAASDCLHRFCKVCINDWLAENKECPVCRQKITSHRNLRRDPLFDDLIEALFPNRKADEEQDMEDIEAEIRRSLANKPPAAKPASSSSRPYPRSRSPQGVLPPKPKSKKRSRPQQPYPPKCRPHLQRRYVPTVPQQQMRKLEFTLRSFAPKEPDTAPKGVFSCDVTVTVEALTGLVAKMVPPHQTTKTKIVVVMPGTVAGDAGGDGQQNLVEVPPGTSVMELWKNFHGQGRGDPTTPLTVHYQITE